MQPSLSFDDARIFLSGLPFRITHVTLQVLTWLVTFLSSSLISFPSFPFPGFQATTEIKKKKKKTWWIVVGKTREL
jgi:hypothetical protein